MNRRTRAGPCAFASCLVLRTQHEARQWVHSRVTLEWLGSVEGGGSVRIQTDKTLANQRNE